MTTSTSKTRLPFRRRGSWLLGLVACLTTGACRPAPVIVQAPPIPTDTVPPPIEREMRGVWIATVANIDWPSRPALPAEQQRTELTDLLDRAASAGFNAIILQVRPASDALYRSSIEPWGIMLTGTQGIDPGYDPLAFAIEQAHARGLELHAWVNPFRAGNRADTVRFASNHVYRSRPDLVVPYGAQLWLDPGLSAAQDHVMSVISDITRRYDVDAIHTDDYFYPYPQRDSTGRAIEFPDSGTYARAGAQISRDDWRRANIDRFVERMYREVHAIKPNLKVGISPFGIWRPGYPAGVAGLDAYATIYADARKWLREGWVDYLAPQLYWSIAAPQQSFPALLDWWIGENVRGRHIWPGLAAYRVGDSNPGAYDSAGEIVNQIRLTRERTGSNGYLLYNATSTLRRSNAAVSTAIGPLQNRSALLPASSWLDQVPPPVPVLTAGEASLRLIPATGEQPRWWYVRIRSGTSWSSRVYFADRTTIPIDRSTTRVLVNAIDQAGNASAPAEWRRVATEEAPRH